MRHALAAATLAAAFLAIYLPDIGHGFIKDDFAWILWSRSEGPADLAALFVSHVGFYRPLVAVTFAADHAAWGLNPLGYGLTNLALFGASAALLYGLARRLALPPAAAVLATAVWAFNFHGVNMALLWISGRTSLLVTLFSLAAAHALLAGSRVWAGVLGLAAMLSKEEAVLLPALLTAWALVPDVDRPAARLRHALARTWPLWAALAVYAGLRTRTGAYTPFDAPDFYRFSLSPGILAGNLAEYADRSATTAAAVVLILLAAARRFPPHLDPRERRVVRLAGIWVVATFALTVWLPSRSSLYALLPSVGTALAAGAVASWAVRTRPEGFRTAAIVLPLLVVLLIPVYRVRNARWVRLADLSSGVMQTVGARAVDASTGGRIVLVDDPDDRVSLDAAFGALFHEAVVITIGPPWSGQIVEPGAGMPSDTRLAFRLRGRALVAAPTPGAGSRAGSPDTLSP